MTRCWASSGKSSFFTQRRQVNAEDIETIQQIAAQFAFGDRLLRMTIGGREQSNVDFDLLAAAESSDGALLDDAQEFRLKQRRHFADLVEQQRAGIGELETALRGEKQRR